MSSISNLPLMPPPTINDLSPTPGKLKRLSLVTNPRSPLDSDRNGNEGIGGPSTPRRRGRHPGMRSSISYSPALGSGSLRKEGYLGREEGAGAIKEESPVSRERERSGDVGEKRKRGKIQTQTLTEKHSDLLTLIAQRERRVSELRQELLHQEASLDDLKTRWTNIVSRSSSVPTPHHPIITSSISHSTTTQSSSTTVSASSSTSSLAPASITDDRLDRQQTLAGLLQSALGPGEDAIEGGKRFWGQLVKTVSAAAGGTVPMPEDHVHAMTNHASDGAQAESLAQKLDLSGFKTMSPTWAGVSLTSPPPPANASRLPGRNTRQVSTGGSTGSISDTGSVLSLLDDDEEDGIGGGEVMTPRKVGIRGGRRVAVRSVSDGDERGGGEIAEGWGNW